MSIGKAIGMVIEVEKAVMGAKQKEVRGEKIKERGRCQRSSSADFIL